MMEYISANFFVLRWARKGVSRLSELYSFQNISQDEIEFVDSLKEFVDVTQGTGTISEF